MPLKDNVDEAGSRTRPPSRRAWWSTAPDRTSTWQAGRDYLVARSHEGVAPTAPPRNSISEHPLFILYTSGTTGKPKGMLHTTGGYLLGATLTTKWIFDLKDDGHLLVHGRHRLGHRPQLRRLRPAGQRRHHRHVRRRAELARSRIASGRSSSSYGVTILYTAPTAIRAFMKWGEQCPKHTTCPSLRLLGTVGEPINPEAWMWYHESSATSAARSWTPGGRPRRAAS